MPKDSVPKNTETMTGGTQAGGPKKGPNAELDVGEIDGGLFKVEPHRRTGEKDRDMRARLLCVFAFVYLREHREQYSQFRILC